VTNRHWDPVDLISGITDFGNTSPGGIGDAELLSILSTAGWSTSTNTFTGYVYQFPIQAKGNGVAYNDAQVLTNTGWAWECFSSTCPSLGALSQLNYVDYYMNWNAARTQVTFYAEAQTILGGTIQTSRVYTKVSGDTSNYFSVGQLGHSYNGHQYIAKLLQFGVESHYPATNWQVHQYGITYNIKDGGSRYLSDDNVSSNNAGPDYSSGNNLGYGSDIIWNTANDLPMGIGSSTYVVNADYHNKSGSTRGAGDILFYPSSQLAAATSLWGNQRALEISSIRFAGATAVTGMYITVLDSSSNIFSTGFTPFSVALPSGSTFYVDYTNYGNYFFTNPYSFQSIIPSTNPFLVYSWGGRTPLNIPATLANYGVGARYYDQGNPGNYAKINYNSVLRSYDTALNGMFVAQLDDVSGNSLTQGYTPYSVGIQIYSTSGNNEGMSGVITQVTFTNAL
jgi:hypothetical protein